MVSPLLHSTSPDVARAAHQAFWLLRIGFTVAPILFGLDKFFNWSVHWPDYLAGWVNNIVPGSGQDWMYVVGGIEIAGGRWRSRNGVVDAARLHHRPGGIAGDHRGVVGAVDGDGDKLRGRAAVAVRDLDGIGLHQLLAIPKPLQQRVVGR